MKNTSLARTAVVLGLLSAIGPFAIDMYLPALPAIGQDFRTSAGAVQASLTAFFVSMAASQLVYGPAADLLGRKRPLYFGLALFVAASIGCALAPDIDSLVAFRFAQGLGAGAGVVVPRAVVRDLHTGIVAARLMSLLMLVFSVSPILAPLAGSLIGEHAGWRGIFWAVGAIGVAGFALSAGLLRETLPAAARPRHGLAGAFSAYLALLKDPHFLGLTFIGGFGISSFFVYLANSSFVLIGHYGLTPREYSLAFSANAFAFIGTSMLNAPLGRRFGLARVALFAISASALTLAGLYALHLAGVDHRFAVLAGVLFVGFGFLGLVVPTTSVLALDGHGSIAGTASALLGTLQMITGAIVMGIVGRYADGTPGPMLAGIAAAALAAATLAHIALRRPAPAAH